MRGARGILTVVIFGSSLGGGCARPRAVTVAPTQDELPTFERAESVVPASVGVEGRRDEGRATWVPEIKEPPLTAEEREALGERPEPINWLEFYKPQPLIRRTTRESGGATTGAAGFGGPGIWVSGRPAPVGVGGWSRPVQSTGTDRGRRYGSYGRVVPPYTHGPEVGGASVGVGSERHVGSRQTRADR